MAEYTFDSNTVLKRVLVEEDTVTLFTELPPQGFTKADLLAAFVKELDNAVRWYPDIPHVLLGGVLQVNGRMLTEIALAAGAAAVRLGARAVRLYSPADGEYVSVLGEGGQMAMPVPVLPGMIVEVTRDGGLFRQGAQAVVLNVGRDSVNIAEQRDGWHRRRRDTGWTSRENVKPVGWVDTPSLR